MLIHAFILFSIFPSYVAGYRRYRKYMDYANQEFFMEILDTAPTEGYKATREDYLRNSQGNVIYSICDRDTFNTIPDLVKEITKASDSKKRTPMVLVGNKCDLATAGALTTAGVLSQRQVSFTDGLHLARAYGCPFLETRCVFTVNYHIHACLYTLVICVHTSPHNGR